MTLAEELRALADVCVEEAGAHPPASVKGTAGYRIAKRAHDLWMRQANSLLALAARAERERITDSERETVAWVKREMDARAAALDGSTPPSLLADADRSAMLRWAAALARIAEGRKS